jgi:hypothetical protein
MSKRKTLSPAQHIELGRTIKRIRRGLHEAGAVTRAYGFAFAQQFFDLADALPTAKLERKLVEECGAGLVDGVPAIDVYRGEMEEVDG